MKIGVAGLWHLGSVYSLCLAELGHEIIAYDDNEKTILNFKAGILPIFEPGLPELLNNNLIAAKIKFTHKVEDLASVEALLLTYDTPVDENDIANVEFVINQFEKIATNLKVSTKILIVSQLPVGTCERIRKILGEDLKSRRVVSHPENLRLGKSVDSFFKADRLVVGTFDAKPDAVILEIFSTLSEKIIWMHDKSAEITKHALNTFLAMCVTFMGEISEFCEVEHADAKEVEKALKADPRIGMGAYLTPGLGFAGGTLARDVQTLAERQKNFELAPQ
jgi:UDPglucose 6-dehydrogenase